MLDSEVYNFPILPVLALILPLRRTVIIFFVQTGSGITFKGSTKILPGVKLVRGTNREVISTRILT